MRLIDADKLLQDMQAWEWQELYLPAHFKMLMDEQPTVYYPDLALAALQNEFKKAEKEKERTARENSSQFDFVRGYSRGIANAIEIVKAGGMK